MTDTTWSPLSRTSVVDAAFEELQGRILHGAFSPGDRLPTEQELARALGVSRSTIREALNRLASCRLIRIQHGGSKTVLDYREHAGLEVALALLANPDGEVDLNVVRSVTEMRSVVAPDSARLAALRRSDSEAAELVEAATSMADDRMTMNTRVECCMHFWMLLVRASHNLAYRLGFNSLRVTHVGDVSLFREIIAEELCAANHYRDIAGAINNGAADEAATVTRELVDIGAKAIYAAIDAVQSGKFPSQNLGGTQ